MAKMALFTEFLGDKPKSVTLEILSRLSGHDINVFGIGNLSPLIDTLKKYGATHITSIMGENTENYSPEGYANLITPFIKEGGFDFVLAGATSLTKDLFPRISGILNVGMASEVTELTIEKDSIKAHPSPLCGKNPFQCHRHGH